MLTVEILWYLCTLCRWVIPRTGDQTLHLATDWPALRLADINDNCDFSAGLGKFLMRRQQFGKLTMRPD